MDDSPPSKPTPSFSNPLCFLIPSDSSLILMVAPRVTEPGNDGKQRHDHRSWLSMWPEARQRVYQPPLHLPHIASSLRCTATISRPCICGFPDAAPHQDDDLDPGSWPTVWRDNPMLLAGPPRRHRRGAPACFQAVLVETFEA